MDNRFEILKVGRSIYLSKACYTGLNNRHYADASSEKAAKYILAEE